MKVYIAAKSRSPLTARKDLAEYAWAEGITISEMASWEDVANPTYTSLGWAKWVDNPEWRGNERSLEFFNLEWSTLDRVRTRVSKEFLRLSQERQAPHVLIVDMEDGATTMGRRAFARAVYLLSRCTEGLIYVPVQKLVLDAHQYYRRNRELIDSEFSMAFEPD